MPVSPGQLFLGLGCRRGCPGTELEQLVRETLQTHALPLAALAGIASITLKQDEPGLLALARALDVPLRFFSAAQLAAFEQQLSHRSATAFTHSGCHGVAESAALALAAEVTGTPVTLRITRTLSTRASLAVAWSPLQRG